MRRFATAAAVAVTLLLAWTSWPDSGAALSSTAAPSATHALPGAERVTAALATQPWVRVIIALNPPPSERQRPLPRARLRREVADVQARVLAGLGPEDFRPTRRYEAVSGIAGFVSATGLAKLQRHPDVVSITEDQPLSGALATSVPMIHASNVHQMGLTGTGVTVAVLDSGIDTDHPDLASSIVVQECRLASGLCPGGGSTASGPGAAEDDQGHGTIVTGVIASKGIAAGPGVAPGARIAAYKVTDSMGNGFTSDIDAALSDIIANHPEVRVVNMSLVTPMTFSDGCDGFSPTTTSAIQTLRDSGTISFVAAGNNGVKDGMTFPACVSSAVSVGAVWDANYGPVHAGACDESATDADQVACFSDSDPTLDLLGPGAVIVSTQIGGIAVALSGTSLAAPHAAGTAALVLQGDPGLSVDEVVARLIEGGVPIRDGSNGVIVPRVDARGAIDLSGDSDSDGCSNAREVGLSFDPSDPWDFFDVPVPYSATPTSAGKNQAVNAQDVLTVRDGTGHLANDGTYNQEYDRSPVDGEPKRAGPPNGAISAQDVLVARDGTGLICRSGTP